MTQDTARGRYESLKVRREPFLRRAREMASLTIPSLLPPEGYNGTQTLPETYSDLGARCVTHISSKLLMALLPPGVRTFRLSIPPELLLKNGLMHEDDETSRNLALTERIIDAEIERRNWRQPTNTGLQHLVVAGNVLEQILPDNTIRVYRLDQYVVVRTPSGKPIEIIIEEHLAPVSLPDHVKPLVTEKDLSNVTIPLYTWMKLDGEVWKIHQEVGGQVVPGSKGTYKKLPYNPIRWTSVVGEDYGRGKCEEHRGALMAVEGLSKAVLDAAALASRHIIGVRPNAAGGLNLRKKIAEAKNGDIVVFNPEDVSFLQYQNTAGIQIAQQELMRITQDLAGAFLLASAYQRDAERVTATEVRRNAEELEGVLGGVYSQLSQEMQSSRLNRLILQMQGQSKLPAWPEGMVEPTITTGLEALGREKDVERVSTALSFLGGLPEQVLMYVNWNTLLNKAFTGLGLPDAVRTDAEVQQMQQQQMAAQAATSVAQAAGEQAVAGGQ